MSNRAHDPDAGTVGQIVTKPRAKTQRPSLYKVLLLNDDYTPMEFVVHVLERFFAKSREDATRIMLHVHTTASASAASTPSRSPRPRWPR